MAKARELFPAPAPQVVKRGISSEAMRGNPAPREVRSETIASRRTVPATPGVGDWIESDLEPPTDDGEIHNTGANRKISPRLRDARDPIVRHGARIPDAAGGVK